MQTLDEKVKEAAKSYSAGNLPLTEQLCYQILNEDSKNPDANYYLGLIATRVKKYDFAVDYLNKSIQARLKPLLECYIDLGNVYFNQKEIDTAITYYKKVLELDPNHTSAYNNIAMCLSKQGDYDNAIINYKKALELNPKHKTGYNNLGVTYMRAYKIDEAMEAYQKALDLDPLYAGVYYNMGIMHKYINEPEKEIINYKKALEIDPDYKQVYFDLALACLISKNFEEGWKYYELRYVNLEEPKPETTVQKPKWDGVSDIQGKTIYIYHEQGYGDTIQFARYLPLISSFGAKVLFKSQPELENLLKQSNLNVEIIDNSTPDESVNFDEYILLLSLPRIFKTDITNIPSKTGYLRADMNKSSHYKEKFFNNDDFKIGIFWQGSTGHTNDKNRSIPLKYFYCLKDLPNTRIYSLQKGFGTQQLQEIPEDMDIVNLGETFADFTDTAAAIENLDLVITVDTSIAHLTGALGKQVWNLIPFVPDWRWLLNEDTTPWYETMRIYRQKTQDDWNEVMGRIMNDLKKYILRNYSKI